MVFLKDFSAKEGPIGDREVLERILVESFGYKKGLDDIFDTASEIYYNMRTALKRESGKTPSTRVSTEQSTEIIKLYSGQIGSLKRFLAESNIISIPESQWISVRPTPDCMRPIRASASYSSPVTSDSSERAYFYITPEPSLHSEFIFVTAHETYPGHHLLDGVRRRFEDPIRRQIESPLFYEGWSSYAEGLINDLGYTDDPAQRLIWLRRQAWRAARAMFDVGSRTGRLSAKLAAGLISDIGYPKETAKTMVEHYALSPGYQLCYTMGKLELDRLRDRYLKNFGAKRFHDTLLSAGQAPFSLIEERLKENP